MCSVCANPQPHFQWTFNIETLRDGINVTGDTITLDVVGTKDFGSYVCSVNNNVNGEHRTSVFEIKLDESGKCYVGKLSLISYFSVSVISISGTR